MIAFKTRLCCVRSSEDRRGAQEIRFPVYRAESWQTAAADREEHSQCQPASAGDRDEIGRSTRTHRVTMKIVRKGWAVLSSFSSKGRSLGQALSIERG